MLFRGFVLIFLLPIGLFAGSTQASVKKQGAVLYIEQEIQPGLLTYLKRAVEEARKNGATIFFIKMNTPGGRVDETLDIIDYIPSIPETTVAYVSAKALSAGALISLSCKQLVIRENSTIGDCAPLMMAQDGPKMLGEKFQSPLRASFRILAEKNGYPAKLTEAMVSEDMEVVQVMFGDSVAYLSTKEYEELPDSIKKQITRKKTVVENGRLLTMTSTEAMEYGFARAVVKDSLALYRQYNLSADQIRYYPLNYAEKALIFLNKIAPLLMIIGLVCIYLEIKTPGFGLFGIGAIACFALLFLTKYIVGLADHVELILFVVGLGLLVVEIFVLPGHGFFGAAGILLILLTLVLSLQDFVLPSMPWEWTLFKKNVLMVCIVFLLSVPLLLLVLFGGGGVLARSQLVHAQDQKSADGYRSSEDFSALLGITGTTISKLRPAGYADFDGRRLNVVSDGEFINAGEMVRIKEVVGNRINVERA